MNLKQRIRRLEAKTLTDASDYSHLSDAELTERIITLASDLLASGGLDPTTEMLLRESGIQFVAVPGSPSIAVISGNSKPN